MRFSEYLKENANFKNEVNEIIQRVSQKYDLVGGNCGAFAVALNKYFDNKGEYVAVVNDYEPEYFYHVGLKIDNNIIDGTGFTTEDDMINEFGIEDDSNEESYTIELDDEYPVLKYTDYDVSPEEFLKEIKNKDNI